MFSNKALRIFQKNHIYLTNGNWRNVLTKLNYQKIIAGKTAGRYIGQDDKGDVADEHV